MPVLEEKVNGPLKTVSYQESPIMSTYLVAIVVGLFDYVEDHTSDGIKVRVYCPVGKANQGKFALSVAVRTLEFYKEYFSVPYSLPKLDMIAIPDFALGAMENYGLVTCREMALLYDEQHSAAANKQTVIFVALYVVAHELAHQWFGNLVTMEWWTHLWLNEGFATWVSYLATDSLFPEWKIWTQFLDQSTGGLRLDGLAESHPIEVEINHASEINEIFDDISYRKGASIIRMLESYLGAECFQVDWEIYRWLVALHSQFSSSGSHEDGQWIIPITFCYGSYDKKKSFLLQKKSEDHDVKEFISDSKESGIAHCWIKLNVDQTGFYRVKYDEELAARLRYAIGYKYLTATDRFGILDDSFALCMARQLPLTPLLTLIVAYREEHEYIVLSNLISIASKVGGIVADARPELRNDIKLFFVNLFQYSANYFTYGISDWTMHLGWDAKPGEAHLDAMLRGELLTALAKFGHVETLAEASRRFHAFLNDRNTPLLPPGIRKAAYVGVMQKVNSSDKAGFESLLRVYRETNSSQEKLRILGSLASCPDQVIVIEALNFALSSEVRSQDAVYALAVSEEGREVAWTWLKDKWDLISETYGSGLLITLFIHRVVSPFASFEKVKEIEDFFASRTKPTFARTVKQSIEQVHINANWVESIQNDKNLAQAFQELAYNFKI
ncbi:Peptidase M1, alanine aminopeptidase/leukotriene A4 hydrolase [Corchorus capsularis]|uniref:Alpha-aminoacylpeptide hydrolase n=1 Tax=Corchorus capsularis TaxID=210143 RepID=A0A1R3FZD4_COCAP|nr:Peptidase M1, alanine aminopeptidase/leukotriene A4 hydrolase [Corchorus capsularis]